MNSAAGKYMKGAKTFHLLWIPKKEHVKQTIRTEISWFSDFKYCLEFWILDSDPILVPKIEISHFKGTDFTDLKINKQRFLNRWFWISSYIFDGSNLASEIQFGNFEVTWKIERSIRIGVFTDHQASQMFFCRAQKFDSTSKKRFLFLKLEWTGRKSSKFRHWNLLWCFFTNSLNNFWISIYFYFYYLFICFLGGWRYVFFSSFTYRRHFCLFGIPKSRFHYINLNVVRLLRLLSNWRNYQFQHQIEKDDMWSVMSPKSPSRKNRYNNFLNFFG